jgi:hypothetical protein
MLGPEDQVALERANFDAFCASLTFDTTGFDTGAPAQTGDPAPDGGMGAGGFDPSKLLWDVPEGWTTSGPRQMRHATFDIAEGSECYITLLAGDAGGVAANVNRWRDQVGLSGLDGAALGELPRGSILGQQQPIVEAYGPTGDAILGTLAAVPGQTLFIKLTGPTAVVKEEVERFKAFCASLRMDG